MCNFRNICLQSQLAKIFDISYNTRLSNFLESNNLLAPSQNGFRKNKSTSTATSELCIFIYESLNNKTCPITLFFDLSRAFDTINHKLLLEKLSRIGVRGVANEWAMNYLSERKQIVVIDGAKSDPKDVMVGVPQGSVLGPLFFIIFMNDVFHSCMTPNLKILYADDSNFGITAETTELAVGKANNSADEFHRFCVSHGLLVNIQKTVYMSFLPKNISYDYSPLIKINHQSVEQVNYTKFLGITLDHKMTWERHIDSLTCKLGSACFLLRQLRNTVTKEILRLAYFGLVQSTLSYGLIFWGSSAHLDKVFIMQKRIVRCMVGVHPRTHCKEIFKRINILTLPSLHIYLLILNIKKNEHLFIRNSSVHTHNTRNKNNLYSPFSRLAVGQNSHIYQGILCYNKFISLCGEISNFNKFKTILYEYLLNMAFYSLTEYLEMQ